MNENLVLVVNCRRCGDIDVAPDQVWLVLSSAAERTHFAFHCAECGDLGRGRASEAAVAFLVELIAVEQLDVPAEALEEHSGPALALDDLLDLMLALEGPVPALEPSAP